MTHTLVDSLSRFFFVKFLDLPTCFFLFSRLGRCPRKVPPNPTSTLSLSTPVSNLKGGRIVCGVPLWEFERGPDTGARSVLWLFAVRPRSAAVSTTSRKLPSLPRSRRREVVPQWLLRARRPKPMSPTPEYDFSWRFGGPLLDPVRRVSVG